jgi:error-prone DNA polymerase
MRAVALRLGLREVDGLKEGDIANLPPRPLRERVLSASEAGEGSLTPHPSPGRSASTLSRKGRGLSDLGLPLPALEKLAAADCFRSLGLDRRAALWEVKALTKSKPLPLFAYADEKDQGTEQVVTLPEMPLSEHVVNDYQTLHLSLKAHPLEFLRAKLDADGVVDNEKLKSVKDGRLVSVAGVVLVRQRPGSAKGVVFLTLEDEFSVCNVVIWPDVLEANRAVVMGARLIQIKGRLQRQGDIIHVVANTILDKTQWLAELTEDGLTMRGALARADEVKKPGPDLHQQSSTRHPRNIRIMPKSRDFH